MKTKIMKNNKPLIFVLVLAMVIGLSGCGSAPSPTETAQSFLEAVKTKDNESVGQYYEGGSEDFNMATTDDALWGDFESLDQEDLANKILDFDYAVSNEKIAEDEKTATVDVSITSYAFGDMVEELVSDAMVKALSNMFDEDFDIEAYMEEEMAKKMTDLKKDYNETITLDLVKNDDDKWVVAKIDENSPLVNALTGNMVKALESIAEEYSQ